VGERTDAGKLADAIKDAARSAYVLTAAILNEGTIENKPTNMMGSL
jgi:hypothetical protein